VLLEIWHSELHIYHTQPHIYLYIYIYIEWHRGATCLLATSCWLGAMWGVVEPGEFVEA
jgi:hypothetical protein